MYEPKARKQESGVYWTVHSPKSEQKHLRIHFQGGDLDRNFLVIRPRSGCWELMMVESSPKPEVSWVPAFGQGPHCFQCSLDERGRAPGPPVAPGVSVGDFPLSVQIQTSLGGSASPRPFCFWEGWCLPLFVICLCFSHSAGCSLVLPE